MRHRKALVLWAVLAGMAGMTVWARAEEPAGSLHRERMEKLGFLVGEWQGEGWWIEPGQREKQAFRQTESVRTKLDGMLLVFEGLGKTAVGPGGAEKVTHDAFAILTWDEKNARYRFLAWRAADGVTIDTEAKVGDRSLQWGFSSPQGTIRFTITLTAQGEWLEVGEASRDGQRWFKVLEMRLKRVAHRP